MLRNWCRAGTRVCESARKRLHEEISKKRAAAAAAAAFLFLRLELCLSTRALIKRESTFFLYLRKRTSSSLLKFLSRFTLSHDIGSAAQGKALMPVTLSRLSRSRALEKILFLDRAGVYARCPEKLYRNCGTTRGSECIQRETYNRFIGKKRNGEFHLLLFSSANARNREKFEGVSALTAYMKTLTSAGEFFADFYIRHSRSSRSFLKRLTLSP